MQLVILNVTHANQKWTKNEAAVENSKSNNSIIAKRWKKKK